jgi:hypothetical protein
MIRHGSVIEELKLQFYNNIVIEKMKIMNRLKMLLLLVVILFTECIFSQDFEVSPVIINFNAEPGQNQSVAVTIINHSSKKSSFTLHLGDFVINKEGKKIQMPPASTEHSLVSWISLNPPFIELNPNETKQVMVSIQAPVGDYLTRWAYIYVRSTTEQTAILADKELQAGMLINAQIVIRAIQSPKSNINYKMKINNLQEITTDSDSTRRFSANIDNIGDKITKCKIILLASNLANAKETILSEIKLESYPDTQQSIMLNMPKILAPGNYALAAILDYGSKANLEGTQILIEVK